MSLVFTSSLATTELVIFEGTTVCILCGLTYLIPDKIIEELDSSTVCISDISFAPPQNDYHGNQNIMASWTVPDSVTMKRDIRVLSFAIVT